ncbi:unnamed protein product [Heligmosomoides polygyrus]|uniref:Protein kinase domain-containing protein n=1 Tax=Heligmosomoides polygyrus TaxID=6339 RepID=A0A3P8E459_HELPZ|nr:unnamed protein product [Heligmosomoides polygyrus]
MHKPDPDPFLASCIGIYFEPVKLLGHGGFGVVFEARNRLDECPYAIKRIARVLREVRAMAKLDHPGIIRYYHTWIERPPDGWQVHIISTSNSIFFQTRSYTYAIKLNTFQSKRTEHLPDQNAGRLLIFSTHSSSAWRFLNGCFYSQFFSSQSVVRRVIRLLLPVVIANCFQLCQEQTLHAWLSGHRSWEDRPLEQMKVWMGQMCSAASYIHQQGLIHRDIKPQNIFFASDQALKIGDLGLVTRCVPAEDQPIEKSVSRFAIHTDNVGTRGYMSPEQVRFHVLLLANKPYTFKVDVFSLGLIYCELVVPFQTLMERSLTLSDLQHGRVPDALKGLNFIAWLTSMKPDERPTCDEILDSDYMAGVETRILMGNRTPGVRRRIKSDAALQNTSP